MRILSWVAAILLVVASCAVGTILVVVGFVYAGHVLASPPSPIKALVSLVALIAIIGWGSLFLKQQAGRRR